MEQENKCTHQGHPESETQKNIDKYGLQVIAVEASDYLPSFVYSIGLTETYKHPEIICFGLSPQLGMNIINDVADLIKNGEIIEIGKVYHNIFKETPATFVKVDNRNIVDYFGVAIRHYQNNPFEALQLVWSDRNGKFPWEEDFEEDFLYKQPLLDRNVEFKFLEPKNLAIFTTRQWLENKQPILRVVHDEDGDWQFLTGDQMPDDIRIVALQELTKRDLTLNEVFDLEYGESAERDSLGGEWTRYDESEEEEES